MGARGTRAVLLRPWRVPRVVISRSVSGTGALSLLYCRGGCLGWVFPCGTGRPLRIRCKTVLLHRLPSGGGGRSAPLPLARQIAPKMGLIGSVQHVVSESSALCANRP